jgi:hypothetical protein
VSNAKIPSPPSFWFNFSRGGATYMAGISPEELAAALDQFIGTTQYYRHWLGTLYTDGVQFLAENAGAYWLLDAISSHQPRAMKDERLREFQLWRLDLHQDHSADLICLRDTDDEAFRQHIEYTDFPQLDCRLYVRDNVILLPSEY